MSAPKTAHDALDEYYRAYAALAKARKKGAIVSTNTKTIAQIHACVKHAEAMTKRLENHLWRRKVK
jgi:hypothetical protein